LGKILIKIMIFSGIVFLIVFVYTMLIIPHLIRNPLMHDIAQDYIGAKALLDRNKELYPELASAYERIGISWGADHQSTHPPTAYLFVLLLTPFNYPLAQVTWMVIMFACIVITFRVFNLTWRMSLLAGILSLAWPPTIWSLGQLTPIWLLGLSLAYYYRKQPILSGIFIAIASLPKFLAAPSLLYHIWRRKWAVLIGFISVWLSTVGVILLLRPDAISAYIVSNGNNTLKQVLESNNSAVLVSAWRLLGWIGIVAAVFLILYVIWIGLNDDGIYGWACLVWLGIALLPIAWNYSLFPLLPWLLITVRSSSFLPKYLAITALLLPYLAPIPTFTPWAVTLSIILSGVAFTTASVGKDDQTLKSQELNF
jgi:hypothetical protein